MIVGVGIDVIEVDRMRRVLDRHGERFLGHVFSEHEQGLAPGGPGAPAYFAGRWAAKEAVAKALGTGIGERCQWKDISVDRDASGRPLVRLEGPAARTAAKLGITVVHLSISHTRGLACASAVAEGPAPPATNSR